MVLYGNINVLNVFKTISEFKWLVMVAQHLPSAEEEDEVFNLEKT